MLSSSPEMDEPKNGPQQTLNWARENIYPGFGLLDQWIRHISEQNTHVKVEELRQKCSHIGVALFEKVFLLVHNVLLERLLRINKVKFFLHSNENLTNDYIGGKCNKLEEKDAALHDPKLVKFIIRRRTFLD
jgi:hypothetical protein